MGNKQCCDRQEPVEFTTQLPIHNQKSSIVPPKEVEKPKCKVKNMQMFIMCQSPK
jgi:hypothetical protein